MMLIASLALLVRIASSLNSSDILVFYSELTSESILLEFSKYENKFKIYSTTSYINILEEIDFEQYSLFLDITSSQAYLPILDSICEALDIAYITISPANLISFSKYRFHIKNSFNIDANALSLLIKYLHLKNIAIIISSNYECVKVGDLIKNHLDSDIKSTIVYDENINQHQSNIMIQGMVKVKGIRNLIIIDNGNSLKKIQNSIKLSKLTADGRVIIFFTQNLNSVEIEGSLIICQQQIDISVSENNFYSVSLAQALDKISLSKIKPISNSKSILDYLNSYYETHFLFDAYYIFNIQNSAYVNVGSVNKDVEIYSSIIYPGGSTNPNTEDNLVTVKVSIANGTSEIYNSNYYYAFSYLYEAARYAVYRSNAMNEFPNFRFELFNTDCGIFAYDPSWYDACFLPLINNLGIAYMTSLWTESALGNILTLRKMNVFIPQISALSQDNTLDNKTEYPEFFKLTLKVSDVMPNSMVFMRSFEWKSINIFFSEEFTSMYKEIHDYSEENGFYFVNPESMRIFPANYTRQDFLKYRSYFEAAKNNNCRIFGILASVSLQYIIEGLYDVGLRKGDFITFGGADLYRFLTEEKNEEYLKKIRELLPGSFVSAYAEWSGILGKTLKAEMSKIFPETSYMCMVYDSFSVIKNAFEFMLKKGLDYENTTELTAVIRNMNSIGCLGSLSFDKQTNSKATAKFLFQQIILNETTNNFYLKDVMIIDRYSTNAITAISEIEWTTQDKSTPTNFRAISDCPFDSYLVKNVSRPKKILYGLSTFFAFLTIISAYLSSKLNQLTFTQIEEKVPISLSDYIFMSYFFFQIFQYLTQGPDQKTYQYIVNNFQIMISLDFNLYFNLKNEIFWHFFYSVLVLSYLWIFLCIFIMLRIDLRFSSNYIISGISLTCDIFLPLFGHLGFIPMISMLFNIFNCNQGIGNNLTESFLDLDCTCFCYKNAHLTVMVLTTISLTFFIPLAVFYRPEWERRQKMLNLRTKPSYLSIMSVIQILIIIIAKTLRVENEMIAGIIISCLLACLLIAATVIKPFNYMRMYIMQLTSLTFSLWGILTATAIGIALSLTTWILIEFVGSMLILIFGIIALSRYKNLLYSNEKNIVPDLFIFQFSFGKKKYVINDSYNNSLEEERFNNIDSVLTIQMKA
ncbi:hypothetical protein SteCoe_32578 [Stentor coeruleus]|uniref:Receptor ligand binding region domain-containing protein n=1 Tax=Stentor coeruleus TaxID=5963 RepID=A0A1R2AYR1_9CILI|nr:hypothetical protein SteCoe_32578 [Stentor coeruleus]